VTKLLECDMHVRGLKCISCSTEYDYGKLFSCDECHEFLEIIYDMDAVADSLAASSFGKGNDLIEKYSSLLPVKDASCSISLGEGSTPLLKSGRLAEEFGLKRLYLKDETRNPTGTFKDRSVAVGVSVAKENHVAEVSTASTGNAGTSLAAYSAKAGMKCRIIIPATASQTKLIQALSYGATIIPIKGSVDAALRLLKVAHDLWGWYPIPTSGPINPYQAEGAKTIAYEISADLFEQPPDWVLYPICGGDNIAANWKGFKELEQLDMGVRPPKLVGVQANACASLEEPLREGHERIRTIANPQTIASSICIEYPPTGLAALRAIRESHGVAMDVTDEQMLEAQGMLASREGIFAEPASASVIAGLKVLLNRGIIASDDNVVCVITGTGLKEIHVLGTMYRVPRPVEPTRDGIASVAL
jgi:threonine synthase